MRTPDTDQCTHGSVALNVDAAELGAYVAGDKSTRDTRGAVAIKDNVDVRGVPTRAGSAATPEAPVASDADVVQRLRRHGFTLGPKTAMDEFAFTTYGPGVNPYDDTRVVGGSSAGSALAVAAGEACTAIGTDTGGSVRIPAAYCGVVGFKPTHGRIPVSGVVPLSWSLDHVGVLGCSVRAVAEVAAATMNPLPGVTQVAQREFHPLAGLRIGRPDETYLATAEPEVRSAYEDTLGSVRSAGATVVPVSLPSIEAYAETHMYILLAEAAHHHRAMYGNLSHHGADVRRYIEAGSAIPSDAYLDAQRHRAATTEQVDNVLAEIDLLALPTTPVVAPRRGQRLVELSDGNTVDVLTASIWYTHLFNHTGMPAISLPVASNGLPVGIQLVAARGGDEFLLRSANSVEQRATT